MTQVSVLILPQLSGCRRKRFGAFMVLCLPWQVCMEGEISRQSIMNSLSRGKKASGDLIPWTISEQVGDLAVHLHPGCVSSISWSQSAQLYPLN